MFHIHLSVPPYMAAIKKPVMPGMVSKTSITIYGRPWSNRPRVPDTTGSHFSKYVYITTPFAMASKLMQNVGNDSATYDLKRGHRHPSSNNNYLYIDI